jgi:hypothetical protein
MTAQMDDLAAQRGDGGWLLAWVPHGGNSRLHLLDENGNRLRAFELASVLPEFSRFARWTTAGRSWCQQMLAYFTADQRHFVVRAWWGARLVIGLDKLAPVDPHRMADGLHRVESELVLRELRQLVARIERGETPGYNDASNDVSSCSVDTLAHLPGVLGLAEAVPLLRVLEARKDASGECWGSFRYHMHSTRQLAQVSLRRLGAKPQGYPVLTFTESEERVPLRTPQPGPVDGPTRHANLSRVRKGTPLAEVYRLLGSPDEVGGGRSGFWRYDVDADPPYTALLWLGDEEAVARVTRYYPPFWTSPDVFPSREHSLLGSDGTTVAAYLGELDSGAFVGTRIEVDVLHELESSGRYPQVPLARAVLSGATDAILPLADALDEADDPRASQVRAWAKT